MKKDDRVYLREEYHKLILKEFNKYEKTGTLQKAVLTPKDIEDEKIPKEVLNILIEKGFLLKISENKFRTLLMDIAFRASDIRIKHGGTKYVLESKLTLRKRPILHHNYVIFNEESRELKQLKESLLRFLDNKELVDNFLKGLSDAGIKGLSSYQFWSIMKILNENRKDAVVSAPTAFGKTYSFIIPILLESLKANKNGINDTTAIIFYPRKSLGSDQMGKLIRLVYYINKNCDVNITIGIDDGDVKRLRDLKDGEQFRGIKCPLHPDETLIIKNRKVYCNREKQYLDFIRLSREDFERNPPTIVISNIWAYQYRLANKKYWNNGYISKNMKYFVFDEVHAYRSLVAGIIRYLIKIQKSLVNSDSRLILSSATIPQLEEFTQEITGSKFEEMLNLTYSPEYHGKDSEKLELYLLIGINPYTSWETYTHELAIFLSTINRLKKIKNLQSLVFVDSIKNINRLYAQSLEALKLGDPKDHFNSVLEPHDPFSYWVYNNEFKVDPKEIEKSEKIEKIREEIKENIKYHYSQLSDRFEIEEKIKNGDIDVVYSTSTLELGVDYDNVSVIVNTGIPFTLESIVQRVGRAGRKEETTLNTSLSIIVVRNNPLEYFYLYKGIDSLINPAVMKKIPVSYTNQFVIFYSAMLYITSIFAEENKSLNEGVKTLEALMDYFNKNRSKILDDLKIDTDISRLKAEIESLIKIVKDEKIEDKCKEVHSYINSLWLQKSIDELKSDLEEFIQILEVSINDVSKREIEIFRDKLNKLKSLFGDLVDYNEIESLKEILQNLVVLLHDIANLILFRGIQHPLWSLQSDFREMAKRSERYVIDIEKIGSLKTKFKEDEYGLYARACEIYKNMTTNIIQLIENIIGFRFMGNEFIDQLVALKSEFETGKGKEEFFTNIVTRMPPFELVNIPFEVKESREISTTVGARHFWLPRPKRSFVLQGYSNIYSNLIEESLAKGKTTKLKNISIPERIEFMDVMTFKEPIILKINTKKGPLYIKYGSDSVSNAKIKGKYEVRENVKFLYSLDKSDSKYELIRNATISLLKKMDNDLSRTGNKWGVNFRYVSMCKLGRCFSTDPFDFQCPKKVQEECRLCDGKKLWNVYRKIFPKFFMKLTVKNLPQEKQALINTINIKTYEQMKEDIEFVYDSAYVYLPIRFSDYMLREIEIEPLGYMAKTSYIVFNLNLQFIELITDMILKTNKELLELMKFKYYMYTQYKSKASSLDSSLMCLKYNSSETDENLEEFKQFVRDSLIHSLTHMFYTFLAVERIGIDPDRMVYFINGSKIYILENSKNDGIGIVETIKSEILSKGKEQLLNEFYEWCGDFLKKHNSHIINSEKMIKKESKDYVELLKKDEERGQYIKEIMEKLEELNKKISLNVPLKFVDIITYRHVASHQLDIPEDLSEYLLTMINSHDEPHLCFDGCNECLIFSTGCSEPFAQVYLVSKQLLSKFLDIIEQKNVSIIRKGIGKIIENLMESSKEIVIKSPFIDDFGIELVKKMVKSKKKISLITRVSNSKICEEIRKLGVKVSYSEERFHAKIYYFKMEDEEVCVQGSVNLTKNSFQENEENIMLLWNKDQIAEILKNLR